MTAPEEKPEDNEPIGGGLDVETASKNKPEEKSTAVEWKIEDLPADAQAFLRKQVADAEAKARTTSKANAAAAARDAVMAEFAEKLGLKPAEGEKPDPDALAAQLAATHEAALVARRERDLVRAATRNGGDEPAMSDSSSFMAKLHKLGDPDADGYAEALDKLVKAEIEATPRFKAAGKPGAATGATGDFGGGKTGTDVEDLDVEGMRKLLTKHRDT